MYDCHRPVQVLGKLGRAQTRSPSILLTAGNMPGWALMQHLKGLALLCFALVFLNSRMSWVFSMVW